MKKNYLEPTTPLPTEGIEQVIYFVRGYKVMLDRDLEELENWRSQFVTSKNKNEFKGLTENENLMSQIVTSSWGGTCKLPPLPSGNRELLESRRIGFDLSR